MAIVCQNFTQLAPNMICVLNRVTYFDKLKVTESLFLEKNGILMWAFVVVSEHQNGHLWYKSHFTRTKLKCLGY